MTKVQFGFIMPADQLDMAKRGTYVEDLDRAFKLVSGHFDSAWIIDHLDADLEAFTALTYMAAQHPKLKFGHTVICQSFRNPALLAKMAATLQFLSGERYILGIGAGWNAEEHRAYGYDFPSAQVRVDQLEETLQIVRAMWSEERATFEGRYYHIKEAVCEPKPVSFPIVMVGAFRPRMMRLTAKYADWWNVSSTGINAYRHMVHEFERACLELGRDPMQIRRTWAGGCVCAPTQEAASVIAGSRYDSDPDDDFDFVGTPGQIIQQMRAFIDLGVDYFMLDCGGFPDLTTLELLVSQALPALNS